MSGACRRKSRGGFFAAGEEFQRALEALSDGAFKVYAWACLHAARPSGRLAFERVELARSLGKSRSALGRHLRELERAGVCDLESAPNQHRGSVLAVRPAYWPYRAVAAPAAPPDASGAAYVAAIRQAFLEPTCVQAAFGPADARLAAAWHAAGVPLESARRALLLGCTRKSLALLGRPGGQPIRSLRYFEPLLREVEQEPIPDTYWRHLEFNLRRCEQSWQRQPETAPGAARPNLAQADPAPAAQLPGRGAERGDDGAGRSRDPRDPLDGGPIEEAC